MREVSYLELRLDILKYRIYTQYKVNVVPSTYKFKIYPRHILNIYIIRTVGSTLNLAYDVR